MDPLLIIALLVAVLAAGGFLYMRRRDPALPGSVDLSLPPSLSPDVEATDDTEPDEPEALPAPAARPKAPKNHERYRDGLAKTRGGFVAKLATVFRGKPKVDDDLRDDVEEILFTSDIGTQTAQKLMDRVSDVLDRDDVADPDAVWSVIRQAALEVVDVGAPAQDFTPDPGPYVLLMIGVNGVGKTTTLGKLAARHAAAGRKVLLVAADTFRAAAMEQLEVWAERVGCDIHKGTDKADPSSVIFEGIQKGREGGYDVVLCDTAGRLHTRKELMDELAKVGRAAAKAVRGNSDDETLGPHDTFLVLDATIGQNALAQAKLFKETMDFTGLVVTKLDGTAKGGVVLGICDELGVPIRHIGIGEGIDDLRDFEPQTFVDALFFDEESA